MNKQSYVKGYFNSGFLLKDTLASFVVFLVALPLSVGIALASGASPMSGVWGAIVGGIVVGALGGAPLQVSGPAAGLTVLVFGAIEKYGIENLFVITVIAGLLQMALSRTRCAEWITKIPHSVVDGMLSGIGVLIATSQLLVVLGASPKGSFLTNLRLIWQQLDHVNFVTLFIGAGVFILLLLWKRLPRTFSQVVPGPLVALLFFTGLLIAVEKIGGVSLQVPQLHMAGSLFEAAGFPQWQGFLNPQLFFAAVIFALVASTESLLCAVATDQLHAGPRANLRKELFAQGAGNTVSGLLGGLPITGVIVRSYANTAAGAKTRLSAMLHGVWLLVFVGAFGSLLRFIPLAAMAGLLVFVGYQLISFRQFKLLFKNSQAWAFLLTCFGCVFLDLLSGVLLGLCYVLAHGFVTQRRTQAPQQPKPRR